MSWQRLPHNPLVKINNMMMQRNATSDQPSCRTMKHDNTSKLGLCKMWKINLG